MIIRCPSQVYLRQEHLIENVYKDTYTIQTLLYDTKIQANQKCSVHRQGWVVEKSLSAWLDLFSGHIAGSR